MRNEFAAWAEAGIHLVVSLTPLEEIASRSPAFHRALIAGELVPEHLLFPILDFDVPGDRMAYLQLVTDLAGRLRSGKQVLVHCFGGVGRTGMTANAVLLNLGVSQEEARKRVQAAGAGSETPAQRELVDWISRQANPA